MRDRGRGINGRRGIKALEYAVSRGACRALLRRLSFREYACLREGGTGIFSRLREVHTGGSRG